MYLIIGKVDGHTERSAKCNFIECEKNGSKYLVFGSTDENKEVLKKYAELWDGIINEGKKGEYGKDFMEIKIIGILKILVLSMSHVFAMVVMI